MYNRYIPQSDGSYRRNRMQDSQQRQPAPQKREPQRPQSQPVCPPTPSREPPRNPPRKTPPQREVPLSGFLRQLLPKDLDTGDLLVIVLLLLMAGDCQEDKNTALLTLALYLFM